MTTLVYPRAMSGSPSKQPQPSSKDGKIRDPEVARLVRERGASREAVHGLIKKAVRLPKP